MTRPYRIVKELEAHLDRGELDFALALARTMAAERALPLELPLMLRFMPLLAAERPVLFDPWALRWLERWCAQQRSSASIDDAVEVVGGLAEIAVDPEEGLRRVRMAVSAARRGAGGAGRGGPSAAA